MAFQAFNVGAVANDGTGDTLRAAFVKVNTNWAMPALLPFGSPGAAPAANQLPYYASPTAVSYAAISAYGRSLIAAADAAAAAALLGAATIGALNLKANLASPALTGTPSAPTAAPGTSSTQIATTAFAAALGALKANLASPALTGTPTAPTAAAGTDTTQLATTAGIVAERTAVATLTNKTLTNPILSALPDPTTAQQAATKNYVDDVWRLERRASGNQALGSNPNPVILQFPSTGAFASGLAWDATNHRCSPTQPGLYRVEGFILATVTTPSDLVIVVCINGIVVIERYAAYLPAATTGYRGGSFSIIVPCNGAGDYIDIRVVATTGGSCTAWAGRRLQISRVTRSNP